MLTPETNIICRVNYISIKKNTLKSILKSLKAAGALHTSWWDPGRDWAGPAIRREPTSGSPNWLCNFRQVTTCLGSSYKQNKGLNRFRSRDFSLCTGYQISILFNLVQGHNALSPSKLIYLGFLLLSSVVEKSWI